ncbi:hypothetical protein NIIDMKKI_29870 [Mycobacterium kansasii]|uniref:Uncharacterized protein n=1 Tax=Mycobacterium kansasii TaxID=1768 RepID=A0A7G1I9S6_MYCKA|nr:hypothetical protein NIIDMKKI_29870 [Mycobacterium kansasii]
MLTAMKTGTHPAGTAVCLITQIGSNTISTLSCSHNTPLPIVKTTNHRSRNGDRGHAAAPAVGPAVGAVAGAGAATASVRETVGHTMAAATRKETPLATKSTVNTDIAAVANAAAATRKPAVRPTLRTPRIEAIVRVPSWLPINARTTDCCSGVLARSAAVRTMVSTRKPLKPETPA